jgi:hypothetical protein
LLLGQDLSDTDVRVRHDEQAEAVATMRDASVGVAARRWIRRAENFDTVVAQVDEPILGDAGGSIEGRFCEAILNQRLCPVV